jgi:hypothetical protein
MNFGFNAIGEAAIGEISEPNPYQWSDIEISFSIPITAPVNIEFNFAIPIVNYTPVNIEFNFKIPIVGKTSVVVDIENPETPIYGSY